MQKQFLEEVITFIVGKSGKELVDLLSEDKNINEFIIAKKLDLTINQTRNLLYKLSDVGLVSSIRKKDKKKGWYTYFWKIEILKSLEYLKAEIDRKIEQFKNQIKSRETKRFYVCNRCNIEFSEENALVNDFTCNECGDVFTVKDSSKLLREMKKNLDKLVSQSEILNQEIEKEKEKEEKKKQKEIKKESKKKEKEKEKKKASAKNAIKEKQSSKKSPKTSSRISPKKKILVKKSSKKNVKIKKETKKIKKQPIKKSSKKNVKIKKGKRK
jgi:transcription factor E